MMSKKDYKAIATVLKEAKEDFEGGTPTELVLENIEYNLCNYFASTNPRFNVDRFIAACEIPFDYDKFLQGLVLAKSLWSREVSDGV